MSTNNICFGEGARKILCGYSLSSGSLWSCVKIIASFQFENQFKKKKKKKKKKETIIDFPMYVFSFYFRKRQQFSQG